jgi:hypothetical protein
VEDFCCYFLDNHDHIRFHANIDAKDPGTAKRRAFERMDERSEKYSSKPATLCPREHPGIGARPSARGALPAKICHEKAAGARLDRRELPQG